MFRVTTGSGTYYVRFLPEAASFAAEVMAHNILLDMGVIVPRVIGFEHRNETTGLSVMITAEIPGVSVEDEWPRNNQGGILREAGRQIARVHEVSVDGFGWIDPSGTGGLCRLVPVDSDQYPQSPAGRGTGETG